MQNNEEDKLNWSIEEELEDGDLEELSAADLELLEGITAAPERTSDMDLPQQIEWENFEEEDYIWDDCVSDKVLYAEWVVYTILKNVDLEADFLNKYNDLGCDVGLDLDEWNTGLDLYENWLHMSNQQKVVIFWEYVNKESFIKTGNEMMYDSLQEELEVWDQFDSTSDPEKLEGIRNAKFEAIVTTIAEYYDGC